MLRLIGKGAAGIRKEWIPVTIAAAAGGHRLTLREGIKAAGSHRGSDVLAAILVMARGSRRRHRDESHREQRRGGRGGQLQKLFHILSRWFSLLFWRWLAALQPTWDVWELRAIDGEKKQCNSLRRATEDRHALRHGRIEV
jgi:hypothetical protein